MVEYRANGQVSNPEVSDLHTEGDPRVGVITGEMDKWEARKRMTKRFYDDGSMSFFWRAHRVLALILFSAALWCLAIYNETSDDSVYNTKRALVICIIVLCVFGITHLPDGPFRRPHPAFWKLLLALSIIYEVFLVFILFQNAKDARNLLHHIDPELGVRRVEKNYGGKCDIYDRDYPEDPWHIVRDKMDAFVAVHFFGWFFKRMLVEGYQTFGYQFRLPRTCVSQAYVS
ncbi:hypothetical protein LSH36_785g03083 [Paralvinella palmiformis]|uniref:Phosphatidylserine synthase n=1 Tax=Paralvinella palmiformis TaxID=53620 RepID=A0AAD9J0M7_9ANNE|nr:hypothetical protein LSH36_785g03083 [Paralvinella palmiformis]